MADETAVADPLHVLLIEDHPGDARLFRELLREERRTARIRWETSLEAGIEAGRENPPDVVVVDLGLPDSSGLETVERIGTALPTAPVVVLTGRRDLETARRSLEAGAEEFLEKDGLTARLLLRTVQGAIERHRLTRELEAERARLEEVFEAAPAVLALLRGPEHVYELANPAYYDVVGPRELIGRPAREVFPDVEDQKYFDLLDRVYRTGEAYYGKEDPLELEGEDGTIRRLYRNFVYQPRRRNGEVMGIIVHGVDVTEAVEARRKAEESERRFRELAGAIEEVFWLRDPEAENMLYLSPAYEKIWGRPTAEVLRDPRKWIEAVHPEDRETVVETVVRQRRTEFELEYRIVRPDGETRWISDRGFPVTDGEGEIVRVAGVARDVTERRRLEDELRRQALYDALTGLANRHLFRDRLDQALAGLDRSGEMVGLLMLDLDRFKQINDHLGHAAGDRVLVEVAHRLAEVVRERDTAARLGGDEFALILPELEGPGDLRAIRNRLAHALGEPFRVAEELVDVDVTVGGVVAAARATAESVAVDDPTDLVRYADLALFEAKERSGPSFHLFRPSADLQHAAFLGREQELRRAIRGEEFELVFQPIFGLAEGEIWGVEPLARWRHPQRGIVMPGEFIPLAEETGLIHELGELLFFRICGHAAGWRRAGTPLRVTPNLSGHQFDRDGLVTMLCSAAGGAELSPQTFWLEITERVLTRATGRVRELREHGFGILIDDFGTGYSSFSYLRDMEIDGLKMDMSFVHGLTEDPRNPALVETMITMARTLGVRVVAEGIEAEGQLQRLRKLGCELGQGFLLRRPVPAAEVPNLLQGAPPGWARGGAA